MKTVLLILIACTLYSHGYGQTVKRQNENLNEVVSQLLAEMESEKQQLVFRRSKPLSKVFKPLNKSQFEKRLEKTIIPQLIFSDLNLEQAIAILKPHFEKARITLYMVPQMKIPERRVNLELSNISLNDALRFTMESANIYLFTENEAVFISDQNNYQNEKIVKKYTLPKGFICIMPNETFPVRISAFHHGGCGGITAEDIQNNKESQQILLNENTLLIKDTRSFHEMIKELLKPPTK
ncbi:MAG: hypothetical protein SFY92_07765 [Verrucomicrobiae bacterium]|nr:hypothetical protein [Verrucomicrobiae bacterium]